MHISAHKRVSFEQICEISREATHLLLFKSDGFDRRYLRDDEC